MDEPLRNGLIRLLSFLCSRESAMRCELNGSRWTNWHGQVNETGLPRVGAYVVSNTVGRESSRSLAPPSQRARQRWKTWRDRHLLSRHKNQRLTGPNTPLRRASLLLRAVTTAALTSPRVHPMAPAISLAGNVEVGGAEDGCGASVIKTKQKAAK